MPLKNSIIIKTDASTRNGDGVGIAFSARVTKQEGVMFKEEGSRFVDSDCKTTYAETLAALYSLSELNKSFKTKEINFNNFIVIIESDCEHTVRKINKENYSDKVDRSINHFRRRTRDLRSRWIPRSQNKKADAMAREAFRRGEEEN